MSEDTEKFVGFGFWNDHEGSFLLIELHMGELRGYVESAVKMFEETPELFCVEFLAPDPVEIDPRDADFDIQGYQIIPYDGFQYEEIYDHKPRYSKYRIYRHKSVTLVTHPKHWDADLNFDLGEVLN